MRLIDADALITTMQNYYEDSGRLCDELANIIGNAPAIDTWRIPAEEAIERLEEVAPFVDDGTREAVYMAIEALDRQKGKWIEGDMLECNQCHHRMIVGDGAYNFCPNCGAKMDKE